MPTSWRRGAEMPKRAESQTPEEGSDERMYSTVPLETDDGEVVIQQQNVGRENMKGGGEWPDPDTPPQPPAPGAE